MPHKQCGSPTAELERQCNPSIILLAAMRGGLKTKRETMARRVDRAAPADAAITGNTGAVDTKLGNRQLAEFFVTVRVCGCMRDTDGFGSG